MDIKSEKRLMAVQNQLWKLTRKIQKRTEEAEASGSGLPTLTEDEQRAFKVLQSLHDALLRERMKDNEPPAPVVVDLSKIPIETLRRLFDANSPVDWTVS